MSVFFDILNNHLSSQGNKLFHIHIPKTGGTTLNKCFSSSDKFINGHHSFPFGGMPVKGRCKISTPTWPSHAQMGLDKTCLPIAIIRNPFEWLTSYYFHRGHSRWKVFSHSGWQGANDYLNISSFEQFVDLYCDDNYDNWHMCALKYNPWSQILDGNFKLIPRILLYNESLSESIPILHKVLFKECTSQLTNTIQKENISRKKSINSKSSFNYQDLYDSSMRKKVEKKFEHILAISGYSFSHSTPSIIPQRFNHLNYDKIAIYN